MSHQLANCRSWNFSASLIVQANFFKYIKYIGYNIGHVFPHDSVYLENPNTTHTHTQFFFNCLYIWLPSGYKWGRGGKKMEREQTGVIQVGEDSDLDLMMQWLKDMLNWGVGDLKWKCGLAGLGDGEMGGMFGHCWQCISVVLS